MAEESKQYRGDHRIQALPFDPAKLTALSAELMTSRHENDYGGAVKRSNVMRALRCAALLTVILLGASAARGEQAPSTALVVNTASGSVSRLDLSAMKETGRFEVGPKPYGIAVTQDGKTVAVGVEGEGRVRFFSAGDFQPRGETRIGPMHNDHIILTPDGKHILVANFYSNDVVGIDAATMKAAFRIKGTSAPHVVKYGPRRSLAYVTCKKVTGIAAIDPAKRELVKFHQLNVNPRSLTFSPDESRLYFGSFWVDGFFEMDLIEGKVTRLFALPPPPDNAMPQEVTYHGVESVGPTVVLAANEGRSYVDAVDVSTGKLLSRLASDVSKPCCIERIPGTRPTRALVSNVGNASLTLVEVGPGSVLESVGTVKVGEGPKRVAFLPVR